MAKQQDITAVKGDTVRWSSFIYDETTGSTFNFTNCDVFVQVRNGFYPSYLVADYSKTATTYAGNTSIGGLTGGIAVTVNGPLGGALYMCIGSSQSNHLSLDRVCKYDVRVHNKTTDDYTTVLQGNIKVLPKITDT